MKEKSKLPPGTYTAEDGTVTIVTESGDVISAEGAAS